MTLTVDRTSPTTLVCSRYFNAPPERVWAAHTRPDLLMKWQTGPDGWSMPECEVDLRPGGHMRLVWREDATGNGFHLTARIEVCEPPHRMVHVETMHLPDPTPENRVETRFDPEGPGTRMTMTMQVDAPEIMEAMIATGMTDGMEASYARLDASF